MAVLHATMLRPSLLWARISSCPAPNGDLTARLPRGSQREGKYLSPAYTHAIRLTTRKMISINLL